MGKIKTHQVISSIVIIVIVVITVLVVCCCAAGIVKIENEKNRITEGVIIDKSYSAPFSTISYVRSGKVMVPVTYHHPARYSFQLRGEKNEQVVTCQCEVSKEDYDEYRIGSYYRLRRGKEK